jgi:FkbM family methyltransferase
MPITAPMFLMKHPWARKRTRDLWGAWYKLTKGRRFVGRRQGYQLLFDLDNIIDRYLLAFGAFEAEERKILFGEARKLASFQGRRVFLDIGAHWGIYTLWAQSSGLFDRLVAVEADPRNLDQLRANLYLNDLSCAVEVVGAAASDLKGELTFNLAGPRSRDISRVARLDPATGATQRTVLAVRIDDVEPLRGGAFVAKIDVESYEGPVIRGMEGLLTGNRGLLQVEVWPDRLAEFDRQMRALGYARFAEFGSDRYYRNYAAD